MDCSIPGLPVPHCLPEFAQVHVLGISDSIQLSHPLQPSFPLPSIFPLAQTVKLLPTMQETQVRSLGWEDPLEKEVATHSSTLAWKIPWMEEPWGRKESDTTEWLLFLSIFPSIRDFFSDLTVCIRWLKYWSFSIRSSNEYSGLIFFKIDWLELLAVQGTVKSLLWHHN